MEDVLNREGIHENPTFLAFKDLIINLIHILELDRHYIMRPINVVHLKKSEELKAIEEAERQADEDYNKYSQESKKGKQSKAGKKNLNYATAVKAYQRDLEEKNDEVRLIRSLGSIGMTIATFTHELNEISNRLKSQTTKLSKIINDNFDEGKYNKVGNLQNPFYLISHISENSSRFSNWISFANDAVKMDRRKAANINLAEYFKGFHDRWDELLRSRKTTLSLGDNLKRCTLKKTYPIDLDSIFNNLLLNSSDAFLRKDSSSKRQISINAIEEDGQLSIYYEDSGPGLLKDIKHPERIFEAFFTTKKQNGIDVGIGLGMWIVKTTINQYGGNLFIVRARPNFKLKIVFPTYSFK